MRLLNAKKYVKQLTLEGLLKDSMVALAFFLPFERIPSVKVAGFTFKISIILSLLIILLVVIIDRKQYKKLTKLFWTIALFIIWMSVSMYGVSDQKSALKVYLPIGLMVALSLAIGRAYRFVDLKKISKAILVGATIVAIYGFLQFAGDSVGLPSWLTSIRPEYAADRFGFPRLHSVLLEPLFYGNFMLLPIALCASYLARSSEKDRPFSSRVLISMIALFVGTDLLTVSRGALAALVVLGAVITVVSMYTETRISMKKVFKGGVIGVVVLLVLIFGMLSIVSKKGIDTDNTYGATGFKTWTKHLLNTRLTPNRDNREKDDSIAQRATARDAAFRVLGTNKKYWLVGVGPGQLDGKERALLGFSAGDPNVVFVNAIVNFGIVGAVLLFCVMICGILVALSELRSKNNAVRVFAFASLCYIIAWNFQAISFGSIAITHFWFVIGLLLALDMKNAQRVE